MDSHSVHDELELVLKEENLKYSINNYHFFVSNEDSPIINKDYKHISQKPSSLKKNNYELVLFSPKKYIIGNFSNILELPLSDNIKNISFQFDKFTTLTPLNVSTRNTALFLVYYSGIISDFIKEKVTLTYSGFLPIHNYNFFIKSFSDNLQRVSLRNYSSYIDGVFEGPNKVVLVYNELYNTEDIALKDLYIPYLFWKNKTSKEIVILYISFSNDIYNLYMLNFEEQEIMNSATIKKYSSYKISKDSITYQDIINLMHNINFVQEKEVPFPQANELKHVISLIHLLKDSEFTIDDITTHLKYDNRQSNYYTHAAIYLELIETKFEKKQKYYVLTDLGKDIVSLPIKEKYLTISEKILEHKVFYRVMNKYIKDSMIPSINEIVVIMKEEEVYNVHSDSTFRRRASTVQAWIKWIINLPKIYY